MRLCPTCGKGFPAPAEVCPDDGTALGPVDALLGASISDRYRVEARIGSGGMGSVYRAVQEDLERNVAIKVVSSTALENQDTARRFSREAQIIARLHHPATLKLFDFGRLADGRPFLVTEFLEGRTLGALAEDGPMPWPRLLNLLKQVCASLEEAHAQGIIHRDLKPDNVFVVDLNGEDAAKVLDFGIAKLGQSSDTATGLVFGTPAYMSPEQAAGDSATARSDLYSLGVIAYRCLVGIPPFTSEQPMALLLKHMNEQPVPPRQAARDPSNISVGVEALILRLLEKNPGARPASATDVRMAIEGLLNGAPIPESWCEPRTEVREHYFVPAATSSATTPFETTPAHGGPSPADSGPLPAIPKRDRGLNRGAVIALALVLGVGAAVWAALQEAPAPTVEVIEVEPPPPIPPSPTALPPPLEPTRAERAAGASGASSTEVGTPGQVEPSEPAPRRRPKRRKPKPRDTEKVEAPPGFLDFDLE